MGDRTLINHLGNLIEEVHQYGGKLIPDVGGIRVRAPAPLPADLMTRLRAHKPELIRALCKPSPGLFDDRWNPELATEGYVWCLDCRFYTSDHCNHRDNPFRTVQKQPAAPRKCQWYGSRH